jgi:succinyl-CoA synthetase alpha subunit
MKLGVIIGKKTEVIIQGITGKQGSFHTHLMLDYGTKIRAGVTPGKGGQKVQGIPVFDTVEEAIKEHVVDASIIFVPASFAANAVFESLENGIKTLVIITENIPVIDTMRMVEKAKRCGSTLIGPNTPGIIVPGDCKLGIMPAHIFKQGFVGIVSRSGTLTYEIAAGLTSAGLGQSTCIGLGGDPIVGFSFVDALKMFKDDEQTKAVALIGEIGGNLEEVAADFISTEKYDKPVVAYVAGKTAPPGKRMGHAGAIVMGKTGTAKTKIAAFKEAGVEVAEKPSDVARILTKAIL